TIERILEQPEINCFMLVKNAAQIHFDRWRTKLSVLPFVNGFMGWDASQIQRYLQDQFPEYAL
ncbi:uncharacterized protein M437DRAFT_35729, partial [Aureobasidium melanogenum CBS 110374]